MDNKKQPILLDFGGEILEAVEKLEAIICNTPWFRHLSIYDDAPSETKLLIKLLRERSIVIGEVYYAPIDATDEIRKKAEEYLNCLSKKDVDGDLLDVAGYFYDREIEIPPSNRNALYFPHIKAYVRCGDLFPEKLFEFLRRHDCERVLLFNGAKPDENSPETAFYSFEMQAPKSYILDRLMGLQDEMNEAYRRAIGKSGLNRIIPDVKFPPLE